MGLPYALYRDSQQLGQLVVRFEARAWRTAPLLVPLLVFLGMLLVLAGVIVTRPAISLLAGLSAFALTLVSLGLCFVFLRLQLTYWRHDRHATLTVYRQEQRAEYRNEDVLVSFALADVVRITRYDSGSWGIYSYQVFTLRNGTELLLTCLMYSMLGPEELLPDVPRQTVRKSGACLPGDELNFPTLF
ncbi:hypothetical protein E4631_20610 [Hymenobacter sp. UV11]|nr:hypothetical protein [Hymenobacter sp. UV11]TDN40055.1 hypothetical protein A8B98_15790 [Hymenobacter sp. UV11]TFZ64030.1 hypothetical protein E4631_20610 [Hymenobacter sp. UV11]